MSNATFIIKVQSGQKGERGFIGPTPQLTVVDTITGAPNTSANVSIAGTAENPELTFTIPQGRPFIVEVEYPTITDLQNNTNSNPSPYTPTLFDLAIIVSDQGAEDPDNAKLYIFDNGPIGGWSFVSDLSGATGPRRELRWKPDNGGTTSILQWRTNDGTAWDEANERDLALDFNFDGTELTISNIDGVTATKDLGAYAEFGNGTNATVTSARFVNPDGSLTSFRELGVYSSFEDTTKIVLTNPDGALPPVELGLIGEFGADSGDTDTTLKVSNPQGTFTKQELGVYADFDTEDVTKVIFTNPDQTTVEQELGLYGSFDSEQSATTLVITNPDAEIVEQELGVYAEWGTIQQGTNRTLILTNPDNQTVSRDLGIAFDWDGTQLGIKTADDQNFTYVDLKGDTGDAGAPGTSLFRIRDDLDTEGNGYLATVSSEMKLTGENGIKVERSSGVFTFSIPFADGGEF